MDQFVMSALAKMGGEASLKNLSKMIAILIDQPEELIKSVVKLILRRGINKGFLAKRQNTYVLFSRDNIYEMDSEHRRNPSRGRSRSKSKRTSKPSPNSSRTSSPNSSRTAPPKSPRTPPPRQNVSTPNNPRSFLRSPVSIPSFSRVDIYSWRSKTSSGDASELKSTPRRLFDIKRKHVERDSEEDEKQNSKRKKELETNKTTHCEGDIRQYYECDDSMNENGSKMFLRQFKNMMVH